MLISVFFLKSDGVIEDYSRIMSYSVTTDDFTAIAETVKNYILNESAIKEVFSEGLSEEYIYDESYEDVTAAGGEDVRISTIPDNCSFLPLKLTTPMIKPVENGRYTSYFGFRVNPITKEYGFHTGLDIAAKMGTIIRAALSGSVVEVGEDERAGKYIKLSHQNGLVTFYCHCDEILAEEGANIRQGETIAVVGSTGMSTGPHLHFEVRKNNLRYDPLKVLSDDS
jgi:murein DD-endopeptidase MepM/ murein hydrolase activator NlpD